jgi:hypothetical protein
MNEVKEISDVVQMYIFVGTALWGAFVFTGFEICSKIFKPELRSSRIWTRIKYVFQIVMYSLVLAPVALNVYYAILKLREARKDLREMN